MTEESSSVRQSLSCTRASYYTIENYTLRVHPDTHITINEIY